MVTYRRCLELVNVYLPLLAALVFDDQPLVIAHQAPAMRRCPQALGGQAINNGVEVLRVEFASLTCRLHFRCPLWLRFDDHNMAEQTATVNSQNRAN